MAGTTARGRYAKTAALRQSIAAAALDLVVERGHADITTTEIAERAGMSKTAALYHFPSRDHMLVAALTEHVHRTHLGERSAELSDIPQQAAAGVGRTRIVSLYQAMLAESDRVGHPAHDYFRSHFRLGLDHYSGRIRAAQADGSVSSDIDPVMAARIILAAWDGLQIQWLNEPSFDMAEAMQRVLSAALTPSSVSSPIAEPVE